MKLKQIEELARAICACLDKQSAETIVGSIMRGGEQANLAKALRPIPFAYGDCAMISESLGCAFRLGREYGRRKSRDNDHPRWNGSRTDQQRLGLPDLLGRWIAWNGDKLAPSAHRPSRACSCAGQNRRKVCRKFGYACGSVCEVRRIAKCNYRSGEFERAGREIDNARARADKCCPVAGGHWRSQYKSRQTTDIGKWNKGNRPQGERRSSLPAIGRA